MLGASVLGFYMTSDAFDERVLVLAAARDIADGDTVSATDFRAVPLYCSTRRCPTCRGRSRLPFFFEGMVAVQPIPAGSLADSPRWSASPRAGRRAPSSR